MTSPELPEPEKALIVGISGPSSSGKTTLARLLQRIFCGVSLDPSLSSDAQGNDKLNTFIIHEDDFYYPDDQIPYTTTPTGKTVQDWDTSAAIDTSFLAQALSYVRANGHLPPRLQSKEDQNEDAGPCVPDTLVTELRREVEERLASAQTVRSSTLVFMEGFLLYAPPEGYDYKNKSKDGGASVFVGDEHYPTDHGVLRPVHQQIGLPLFLPAAYATVKARREGRSGYVTIGPAPEPPVTTTTTTTTTAVTVMEKKQNEEIDLEGEDDRPPQNFWTDPPGYVDDIVWPRYVRDHAWLLVDGDGDGEGEEEGDIVQRVGQGVEVRGDVGVNVAPGKGAVGMEVVLRWAVEEVIAFYLGEKK